MFGRKTYNNKGFSLIELVIAIALLAICITPALKGFVTSAMVSNNSRELMNATECTETILEGFSNKDYEDVKSLLGIGSSSGIDTQDLMGILKLSSVSNDFYNKSANAYNMSNFDQVVSINKSTMQYKKNSSLVMTVSNSDAISGNSTGDFSAKLINQDFYAQVMLQMYSSRCVGLTTNKLYYWYSPGGDMTCMCFSGVPYGPYEYDIVISFIPEAKSNADTEKFYSYSMFVSTYLHMVGNEEKYVYDSSESSKLLSRDADCIQPVLTMSTGMRNR